MKEVEYITLEGKDYIIIDSIKLNDTTYEYLINENDEKDFFVRKLSVEVDGNYFVNLETDEEFDQAMTAFYQKHKND